MARAFICLYAKHVRFHYVNHLTHEVAMVTQQIPSSQRIPSKELDDQLFALEPVKPAPQETAAPALTASALDQQAAVWTDESYYVHHWGINE